jgi:hypothetical protein
MRWPGSSADGARELLDDRESAAMFPGDSPHERFVGVEQFMRICSASSARYPLFPQRSWRNECRSGTTVKSSAARSASAWLVDPIERGLQQFAEPLEGAAAWAALLAV